jgi:ornithine--oxo-acid transaminase
MIADEIQTGLGRTGKLLCVHYNDIMPDILILGKALSGGMMPISAVLCNDEIMLNINPGEHGSTFGGNPLAARVAITALEILIDEGLIDNAWRLGNRFRERLNNIESPYIKEVRGKGLFNAIKINSGATSPLAYELCLAMKNNGLLAKQTHGNIIRFAPPLVINDEQLEACCDIIEQTFMTFPS